MRPQECEGLGWTRSPQSGIKENSGAKLAFSTQPETPVSHFQDGTSQLNFSGNPLNRHIQRFVFSRIPEALHIDKINCHKGPPGWGDSLVANVPGDQNSDEVSGITVRTGLSGSDA